MKYIYEMPGEYLVKAKNQGTVECFEYDTNTYDENNEPLRKGAWVYLPYGYSTEKQYNVLYLLHGGGVSEDWWFKMFPDTVDILDNMIEKGICKPCIIVTPTYYRKGNVNEDAEYITEHFHTELRRDLIPQVEKHYSSYCGQDVSEKNLVANREHRAIAGLSLGSMTTYRAGFYNNYDIFAWYGPFSGCCGPFGDHDKEVKRIKETLIKGYEKGHSLKYMFCANGDKDIAYAEHIDIMTRAVKESNFLVEGSNYDMYIIPGGVHDMKAWQLHLFHALQVFFAS